MTVEQIGELHRARRAAQAYARATQAMAEFLDHAEAIPDPALLAEYATLLAREASAREIREESCAAIGLEAPSIG
jgi:hypothetical protein